MDLKEIQTDLKETTDTNLKETQRTYSKRNSNHGLKRKTTETKRDRRWACGARDRRLWWRDEREGNGSTIHGGVVMMMSAAVADVCVDSVSGGGWWVDGS